MLPFCPLSGVSGPFISLWMLVWGNLSVALFMAWSVGYSLSGVFMFVGWLVLGFGSVRSWCGVCCC